MGNRLKSIAFIAPQSPGERSAFLAFGLTAGALCENRHIGVFKALKSLKKAIGILNKIVEDAMAAAVAGQEALNIP